LDHWAPRTPDVTGRVLAVNVSGRSLIGSSWIADTLFTCPTDQGILGPSVVSRRARGDNRTRHLGAWVNPSQNLPLFLSKMRLDQHMNGLQEVVLTIW
jgi:hypothetical protein